MKEAGATSLWLCFRGYISVAGGLSGEDFGLEVAGLEALTFLK